MKQLNEIDHKRMIVKLLRERIEAEFCAPASGLWRFEVPVHDVSFLEWLNAQNAGVKTYFSSRDDGFEMAGLNAADMLDDGSAGGADELFAAIEKRLAAAYGSVKYYGAMAFDPDAELASDWRRFGKFRFLVPQVELVRQAEGVSIAFNIMAGAEDTAMTITGRMLAAIDDLVFDADADMEHCRETTVLSRTDLPDRGQWVDTVVRVLSDIEKGKLAKLVLARRTALEMSKAVSPFALLSGIKNGGSGTYDFCFQVDGANAFVGASPERLFTIQGSTVYSEALAGTRSTASSKIAGNLLDSDKEIAEHNFVVDDVAGALKSLCDNVETIADKQIVTLPNLQHISSAFKGRLRENISIGDIIRSIHPTSAVNGSPRELAMQEIERLEPFGRGLYAGPVGWIGEDCADFAVAIRSAVVAGDVISLYAGAGIVESSDPSLEWEETETKISRFLQAVGQ